MMTDRSRKWYSTLLYHFFALVFILRRRRGKQVLESKKGGGTFRDCVMRKFLLPVEGEQLVASVHATRPLGVGLDDGRDWKVDIHLLGLVPAANLNIQ